MQALNPDKNTSFSLDIAQVIEPIGKQIGFANFYHKTNVSYWLHSVKCFLEMNISTIGKTSLKNRLVSLMNALVSA
jgi:hypothetical protein